MRGASALDQLLAEYPQAPIRVFLVWEPALKTDVASSLSDVLTLLDDPRVTQYWDPGRVVSNDLVRSVNEDPARYGRRDPLPPDFIAWDVVAVFGQSARWERDLPVPAYYGGPVVNVINNTRKALAEELAAEPEAARSAGN